MASYEDIVNSLITSSDGSNETSTKISQALLDQLKKKYALEEGTNSGQIKPDSVFDKIQKQVDIDGETENDSEILAKFQSLIDTSNNQAKNLWNESIKVAVNYFIKRFLDENAVIPVSSETGLGQSEQGGFLIKDIRHANAGLSFNGTAWVKPNYNIDNDIYDDVRGDDKIESVLNNQRNMQFTRTQDQSQIVSETINKYIRLLMPQYTRRVEVEDLNRNFWVIGQVLAGISAYLFDEDSPITNMFKRLISEVNQLWENILYLWTAFNKPITKVHSEVVYLPNNSSSTEMKFDNFDQGPTFDNITERLNYLVDQYTDSNLCICPIIRRENYFKNYYKNEQFSGVWFYNRNKSEWTICKPVGNPTSGGHSSHYGRYVIDNTSTNVSHYEARVYYIDDSNKNIDKVGCIYTDESEHKYYYRFPFSKLKDFKELVPKRYYAGIRTNVYFSEAKYGFNAQGKEFFSFDLQIDLDDYTSIIKGVENHYKESHKWSHNSLNNVTSSGMHYIPVFYEPSGTLPEETEGIEQINISKGFYLGEIPSNTLTTGEIDYTITNRAKLLPPVVEPLSTILYNNTIESHLQAYSENFLNSYADNPEELDTNGIVLYTGSFNNNIFNSANASEIECYENTSTGYRKIPIGGQKNFNPALDEGFSVDLSDYDTLNGEPRESGTYWNRTRENLKLGCILSIPSFEPIVIEKYKYWWSHIPDANNTNGDHSLIRLYTEDDKNLPGRRGDYISFTTFYKKRGSVIKPDTWAIKYTEVFMNYGATSNGGVKPVPSAATLSDPLTDPDDHKEYNLIYYDSKPGTKYNTQERYKYYAPFLKKANIDATNTYQYFLPIVTRIVTHIFIGESETKVSYSRKYQYKIDMSANGAIWYNGFRSLPGGSYNKLNALLSNNYEIHRQSSTVSNSAADDARTMTGKELKGVGDGNPFWMDFEKYPINGYSSVTNT